MAPSAPTPILTGLSAFPITPSDAAGQVDTAGLRRLIARLSAAGVDSVGLLGSTGGYPYLSRAQRRGALDAALDEANGRTPFLVGVGALRTDEATALAQDAKAAGASVGLLAAVSYIPLTDDEVFEHYAAVARDSRLPICIYDNPATTHFRFSPHLLTRLGQVEGIVAMKAAAPTAPDIAAKLAATRALFPDGFSVGASVDWNATQALLDGADAWYSVSAGLFPNAIVPIVRAAQAGDAATALALSARLEPLWALFRQHTSLRVIYACTQILEISQAQPPRPILPLPAEAQQQIADTLRALDLG